MHNFRAISADEVWRQAANEVHHRGVVTSSRNFRDPNKPTVTKELVHASLTIINPRQRLVHARVINPAFAVAEVLWILAGANTLDFLQFWNPMMETWSTQGIFYGAYGARLGSRPNIGKELRGELTKSFSSTIHPYDQLKAACYALKGDPTSRQVVLNIYNNAWDFPAADGSPRNSDVPCNIVSDLKVRDGKLHWLQTMRSNDLMWGTPYNIIQWTCLQEVMAGWLNVEVGEFTLVTSSLHVYENHWEELKNVVAATKSYDDHSILWNSTDMRIEHYANWELFFRRVVDKAVELTHMSVEEALEESKSLPKSELLRNCPGYASILLLLLAECLRKHKQVEEARRIAGLTEYYTNSWLQWAESKS